MASTQVMADQTTSPQALASRLRDYYTLTKPEVNLLILMTTSAGYYLGSEGEFKIGRLVSTLIGTLLVASGTATLNQFMERRYDAQMRRTANRPLVSGRLSAREAFWFGILLSVAGGLYLALAVNTLAALLAVSTLLSYLLVYTPLKRKTPLCTALGAIPGAMPTLIGWAGASAGKPGCYLPFFFCGSSRISWRLPSCIATTIRAQASGCCRPLILKESLRKQKFSSSRSSWYWRQCSLRWQAAGQRFCSVCPRLARSFSITPASWRPQIQNFCRAAWYTLPSSTYL